ncbi:hypothetical protein A2U01_0022194, partial [Trifolium medium]|nr:hypothetical protein [Trifolium medium]
NIEKSNRIDFVIDRFCSRLLRIISRMRPHVPVLGLFLPAVAWSRRAREDVVVPTLSLYPLRSDVYWSPFVFLVILDLSIGGKKIFNIEID